MTCPDSDRWNLLTMNLLDEQDAAAMLVHAGQCASCQSRLIGARADHALLTRFAASLDRGHEALRERLMSELPAAPPAPAHRGALLRAGRRMGDWIMSLNPRSPWRAAAGIAAAACLVFAIVAVVSDGSNAAFARAVEGFRLARTMACNMTTHIRLELPDKVDEQTVRSRLSMYAGGDTRAWLIEQSEPPMRQLTLPDAVYITEGGKTRVLQVKPGARGEIVEGPDQWLGQLLTVARQPDRALGERIIGNRKADGFEIAGWRMGLGDRPADGSNATHGESSWLRVWVARDNQLPALIEIERATKWNFGWSRSRVAMDDIRWDIPLDANAFQPPEETGDETVTTEVPAATEEALIDGLRAYADQSAQIEALLQEATARAADDPERLQQIEQVRGILYADSAYPPRLDPTWLPTAVASRAAGLAAVQRLKARRDAAAAEDATADQATPTLDAAAHEQTAARVFAASSYYRKLLMEHRAPEYFGAKVKPGDKSAVLMRWMLDESTIRIIRGDLSVEDVTAGANMLLP